MALCPLLQYSYRRFALRLPVPRSPQQAFRPRTSGPGRWASTDVSHSCDCSPTPRRSSLSSSRTCRICTRRYRTRLRCGTGAGAGHDDAYERAALHAAVPAGRYSTSGGVGIARAHRSLRFIPREKRLPGNERPAGCGGTVSPRAPARLIGARQRCSCPLGSGVASRMGQLWPLRAWAVDSRSSQKANHQSVQRRLSPVPALFWHWTSTCAASLCRHVSRFDRGSRGGTS
ncbi:hypothetical protein C8Q77DRAFT_901762 [Trametes polyzona]|nr:hypothetical protein C8Q77DRAFT_901762 [Trametes polyzona]